MKVTPNTEMFPVIAGDPFTAQIALRATGDSANSGYVALIFLDGQKEIKRLRFPFTPSLLALSQVTTDAAGQFTLSLGSSSLG